MKTTAEFERASYRFDALASEDRHKTLWRGFGPDGGAVWLLDRAGSPPDLAAIARFNSAIGMAAQVGPEICAPPVSVLGSEGAVTLAIVDSGHRLLSEMVPANGMQMSPLIQVMLALARVTAKLHAAGLLGRDIRPDRILVPPDNTTAQFLCLDCVTRHWDQIGLAASSFGASPRYAAPELSGRIEVPIDERADLYSLGITFAEMISGRVPFKDTDLSDLTYAHVVRRVPDFASERADIPEMLVRITRRLLQKDPDDRYASAYGLVRDLETCSDQFERSGAIRRFDLSVRSISRRFRLSDRLFGRDQEQARLLAAVNDGLLQGKRTVVSISGPNGIGKTAFVSHMRWHLVERGPQLHAGKFDRFKQDQPYLAFIQAVQSIVRPMLSADQDTLEAFRDNLQDKLGGFAGLLTEMIPELAILLGTQPELEVIPPAEATRRFNGVVGRFIEAVATAKSPVIFFLDDLQWADHASLNLLSAISRMPKLAHFMLVLGYRSNEVGPSHPTYGVLEVCHSAAEVSASIPLGPLEPAHVAELLTASLGGKAEDMAELASHVQKTSQGNVFFMREYLNSLTKTRALSFDPSATRWTFDSTALADTDVPASVAVFLTDRLQSLPADTLDFLDSASCIGSTFDLETLTWVSGKSKPVVARALSAAIDATIIQPLGEEHSVISALSEAAATSGDLGKVSYRFRHDQVRQAVHDRLEEGARAERHLQIARLMLRSLGDDTLPRRAVEVFGHVSWGKEALRDAAEKLRYARLGLTAAEQAMLGLAFDTARQHLRVALELTGNDAWHNQPDLMLDLRRAQAKCAFALNDREEMEAAALEVLKHSSEPYDIADVQGMWIRYLSTENQAHKAADLCIDAASQLGVRLPRRPGLVHVLIEVIRTMVPQGRTDPRSYADLPEAESARVRAVVQLMAQSAPAAYFSEPNLLPLLGISATRLSVKHGLNPHAPYSFAVFALVLCGALGLINRGYSFGQLALETAERYGGTHASKAEFVVDSFVRHWKEPLAECVDHLFKSWAQNRDAGDQEDATYCAGVMLYSDFLSGQRVDTTERHPEVIEYLRRTEMPHVKDCFLAWGEMLRLLGQEELPAELIGPDFDYPRQIGEFELVENGVQIAISSIAAGVLDHLAGRYQRAHERLELAAKYEANIVGQVLVPGLAFFRALNAYALARTEPSRAGPLRRLARRQTRRLKTWAKSGPVNLAHRISLLDAERLVARGRPAEALMTLHEACTLAGPETHFYAFLAHQRRFWILRDCGHLSEAAEAAKTAAAAAVAWGAPGLARRIRNEAGITASAQEQRAEESNLAAADLKDFMALVGAVAKETERDQLLKRITGLALTAGNADFAALAVTSDDGVTTIISSTDAAGTCSEEGEALNDARQPLRQVIELCLRSGETVHSDQPDGEQYFGNLDESAPRAFLCVPLVQGENTLGAIYLENHVTHFAFASSRRELVQALAYQAAIALENANLLRRVQGALASQTRQTEANRRFVPENLMEALGQEAITDVDLNHFAETEMTAVFVDIRGFTAISHEIGAKRTIEMINRYLEHVQPGIAANGGFVGNYLGDGVLALFPNGPDFALFGVSAMVRGLKGYNMNRGDLPALSFGAGVHVGQLTLGMIGDPDHIQVGVLGDPVNVASRLENLNKSLGTQVLVSGDCVAQLAHPERFALRSLGAVQVRGLQSKLGIYELLDSYPEEQRAALIGSQLVIGKAFAAYQAGQSEAAARLFDKAVAAAADAGGDPVAKRMAHRCRS